MEPPGGTYNSSSAAFDDFTAIVFLFPPRGFVVIKEENFVGVSRLDDDEDDEGAHRLVETAEGIEVIILSSVL